MTVGVPLPPAARSVGSPATVVSCRKERRFSDEDICKYYICGFCPYEEFRWAHAHAA